MEVSAIASRTKPQKTVISGRKAASATPRARTIQDVGPGDSRPRAEKSLDVDAQEALRRKVIEKGRYEIPVPSVTGGTVLIESKGRGRSKDLGREEALAALAFVTMKRELADLDYRRAVVAAAEAAGLTQREIAQVVGRSQPDVGRTLKRISGDPALVVRSPREVALKRALGDLSDEEMMTQLKDFPYKPGVANANPATDGYVRGSWDEVRRLRREGLITVDEWSELFTHVVGSSEA